MSAGTMTVIAYSAIVVQGALALALLFFARRLSEWTRETRKERLAADLLSRSNANLVDYLNRHSVSSAPPTPLPFTDYGDADEETQDCA